MVVPILSKALGEYVGVYSGKGQRWIDDAFVRVLQFLLKRVTREKVDNSHVISLVNAVYNMQLVAIVGQQTTVLLHSFLARNCRARARQRV